MLNVDLILKIKKKYNINIGDCKKFLSLNNWNYNETLKYINNIIKNNIKKKYNFYSIISFTKKFKIFIIKILFNSVIINNSDVLNKFIKEISLIKFNLKIIKKKINLLSLKLKEDFFFEKILIFNLENINFYNHKNLFFCLINFNKKIINLCYNIIFNKINFLKFNICKKNLLKQNNIKNNELILNIINYNNLNYSILINKNGLYFYYE
ncbi:hypothetical protein ACJEC8_00020 [Candidatus Carsonella ruddii]|uniref:hypothetical protein n=1 Tax=Carsonella ruddii TaxID=114186 RepID=UPI003D454088